MSVKRQHNPGPNVTGNPIGKGRKTAAADSKSRPAPTEIPAPVPVPGPTPAPVAVPVADAPPPAPQPIPVETQPAAPAPAAPAPVELAPVAPVPPDPNPSQADLPPLLFEVAWEVCWQLGGIYTVLKTKAANMVERWGDRYCMIGPFNPQTAEIEFEEQRPDPLIRDVLDRLRDCGVGAYYGRWLVPGRPRTILIDHRSRYPRIHEDKYLMWKDHHIETPPSDGEVNDVVALGFAVAEFFRVLTELAPQRRILAHFHEWMGGVAVPRIAHLRIPVATLFTTHATLLGRYLASDNPHFYEHLHHLDPEKEAAHFNIFARYAIEKAAAHASTVFTTVSQVTAIEAEKLLGRTPDAILPNGLNIERFMAVHEFQNLHRIYKERIHDFVMGHFFPAYEFDIDNTFYFFTSGRYEYHNKGMDLFIEAMARLNWRLKSEAAKCTIVSFIITRAPTRNINIGVLQNQTMFDELKQTIAGIQNDLGPVMLKAATQGRFPAANELFNEEARIRWKRSVAAWKNRRQPSIVTHDLIDDAKDPVLTHIRHRGLFNSADDPVKIIFHPEFVSITSPLIHLDYDQFVRGCHMGIFPSYYEPWGYTPMEAIARGVPAISSDLAGFGAYVQSNIENPQDNGIFVARRRNRSFDDACNDIVEQLYQFTRLNRRQRIELRNRTEAMGGYFDWSQLIRHYHDAHEIALGRITGKVGKLEIRMV